MADQYASDYNKKPLSSGDKPSGYNESYNVVCNGIVSGDTIWFGKIPAGVEINEVALLHDADADATLSLGYKAEGQSAVPAAFLAATALATAGRKVGAAYPLVFNEPVDLIGVVGGGAITNGVRLNVVTNGKGNGVG